MTTVKTIDASAITSLMAAELNKLTLSTIEQRPNAKILNLEEVDLDTIKAYLRTKGSQEWARRSIASEDSMEQTADWFKRELDKLYAFVCIRSIG